MISNFTIFLGFIWPISIVGGLRAIIVGGGPVGLYAAYHLLDNGHTVDIYEKRRINLRPQIVRIPSLVAPSLPYEIQIDFWKTEALVKVFLEQAANIAKVGDTETANVTTVASVEIKHFQNSFKKYIRTHFSSTQYKFIYRAMTVEEFLMEVSQYDLAIVATGNSEFTRTIRSKLEITEKYEEKEEMGLYLKFKARWDLMYERCFVCCDSSTVYIQTPHLPKPAAQFQVFPGDFAEQAFFNSMPTQFRLVAKYAASQPRLGLDGYLVHLDGNKTKLDSLLEPWFSKFRNMAKERMRKFLIPSPFDDDHIQVNWAPRERFRFHIVGLDLNQRIPLLFLGDSAGSTDYKHGQSLGRGLLLTYGLFDQIDDPDLPYVVQKYSDLWNNVMAMEFDVPLYVTNRYQ